MREKESQGGRENNGEEKGKERGEGDEGGRGDPRLGMYGCLTHGS